MLRDSQEGTLKCPNFCLYELCPLAKTCKPKFWRLDRAARGYKEGASVLIGVAKPICVIVEPVAWFAGRARHINCTNWIKFFSWLSAPLLVFVTRERHFRLDVV